jgi:hypothetical protein
LLKDLLAKVIRHTGCGYTPKRVTSLSTTICFLHSRVEAFMQRRFGWLWWGRYVRDIEERVVANVVAIASTIRRIRISKLCVYLSTPTRYRFGIPQLLFFTLSVKCGTLFGRE